MIRLLLSITNIDILTTLFLIREYIRSESPYNNKFIYDDTHFYLLKNDYYYNLIHSYRFETISSNTKSAAKLSFI